MKRKKKEETKKEMDENILLFLCHLPWEIRVRVSERELANSKVFHRESPPEELWRSSWTRFNSLDTNSFPSPSSNVAPLFANFLVLRSLLSYSTPLLFFFNFLSLLPFSSLSLNVETLINISRSTYKFFSSCKIHSAAFTPRSLLFARKITQIGGCFELDEIFIRNRRKTSSLRGWCSRREWISFVRLSGKLLFKILYGSSSRRFDFRRNNTLELNYRI